jgi:hypothetical protein
MKFVKLSLAAAMMMGASAFAIENTKVSGDARLYYHTEDNGKGELFDKTKSTADTAIKLNLTTDLVKGVSAGLSGTMVSTLGLENNLVSGVWAGAHSLTAQPGADLGARVNSAKWMNEAWLATTQGKSTVKLGRMTLDTPLAFTETWSVEENTFEAAVLINQDLPGTTLVGAYIGNGNGTEQFGEATPTSPVAMGALVNKNGRFTTYGVAGAYAAGAINNSWEPLTVQAWYYDVTRLVQAYWVEADLNMNGIVAGVIATGNDYVGADSNEAFSAMLGYEMKDVVTVKVAYSMVGDSATTLGAGFNTATNHGAAQTKMYTEAWWNYGYVTLQDNTAMGLSVEGSISDVDLGLYYTNVDQATTAGDADMSEITVSASKSFGPLDTSLAYVNTDAKDQNAGDAYNALQVYVTLNF